MSHCIMVPSLCSKQLAAYALASADVSHDIRAFLQAASLDEAPSDAGVQCLCVEMVANRFLRRMVCPLLRTCCLRTSSVMWLT